MRRNADKSGRDAEYMQNNADIRRRDAHSSESQPGFYGLWGSNPHNESLKQNVGRRTSNIQTSNMSILRKQGLKAGKKKSRCSSLKHTRCLREEANGLLCGVIHPTEVTEAYRLRSGKGSDGLYGSVHSTAFYMHQMHSDDDARDRDSSVAPAVLHRRDSRP